MSTAATEKPESLHCNIFLMQSAGSKAAVKASISDGNVSTVSSGGGVGESEDDIHYWVPRVRLMFAAEDPSVFARRVAHAHMTRYIEL